ncbi:MAG: diguanylate cyclase [Candidatus Omnitrophica bacterium]|nr:diguanylate cyclase [Candidatus Omnitrophota bacterium]
MHRHKPCLVLLIDHDFENAKEIKKSLEDETCADFSVYHAVDLEVAAAFIQGKNPDIVVAAFNNDESDIGPTIHRWLNAIGHRPLVILFDEMQPEHLLEAARNGVQDYILRNKTDERSIAQVLHLALERYQLNQQLEQIAMQDELTHVHNRRGFLALAEQQLKLAKRNNSAFLLFFMDLDGLKQINDRFGHTEGDQALSHVAGILRSTFRQSDIIGRLGGDEFAVLAVEAGQGHQSLLAQRLQENLREFNVAQKKEYSLSLSMGAESFDPKQDIEIEKLLIKADDKLYEKKLKIGQKIRGKAL